MVRAITFGTRERRGPRAIRPTEACSSGLRLLPNGLSHLVETPAPNEDDELAYIREQMTEALARARQQEPAFASTDRRRPLAPAAERQYVRSIQPTREGTRCEIIR